MLAVVALWRVRRPAVWAMGISALVMTLYTYPFVLLTTRASLRQLDGRMVDAARSLGLALPAALWRVVLPRVRGGIAAGASIGLNLALIPFLGMYGAAISTIAGYALLGATFLIGKTEGAVAERSRQNSVSSCVPNA